MLKKRFILFVVLVTAGLLVFWTPQAHSGGTTEKSEEKLIPVRIGVAPYAMYQLWVVADQLEIDKEFGLEFEITNVAFTIPGQQLVVRGDLDITSSGVGDHVSSIQNAPELVGFSTLGFFQGFIFVGRRGAVTPIQELIEKHGLEQAKKMRVNEFRGKTFLIIPQRKPLIADTLAQVGLNTDDVKFIFFADDQKAALAFIQGQGDFYGGSIPQEEKLLTMEDKYVNAGGFEILGPAGLWYDIMVSSRSYIKENRETCLNLLGVLYRSIRLFDTNPERFAEIGAKSISESTGGEFAVEDYIRFQTKWDDFLSIEEVKEGFYNPESDFYWKNAVNYYIKLTYEEGNLDTLVDADDYYLWEDLFWDFMDRKDLQEKVYAPF